MDHNGPIELAGQAHLGAKHRLLQVRWGEIVVVIEANLTDRARRRRARDLFAHDVGGTLRIVGIRVRLVRVHTNRHADFGPQLNDLAGLCSFRMVAACKNYERPFKPCLARACDDGVQVGCERFIGQVTVGINHGSW